MINEVAEQGGEEGAASLERERDGLRWAHPRPRGTRGGGTLCTIATSGRRQSCEESLKLVIQKI